jgi:myo-inositol-1(or 4)-monophosphatase
VALDPFLEAIQTALREAGRVAQESRKSLQKELKPDGSIVTNGDRAAEEFLRKELAQIRPAPIWGEEFGYAEESDQGLWTVDPVDGTTNFAFGSPLWGVTAAYVKNQTVEAGAVFLPDLDEMYGARRGMGVFCNGAPLRPIPPGPIERYEIVSYCDHVMKRFPEQRWPGKMRCTGAFVVEGAFVMRQRYRGLIGIREKLYDVAACLLMGLELGAEVRFAGGQPLRVKDLLADSVIEEPWVIFPAGSGFRMG